MPEDSRLMILAPAIRDRKGEHLQVVDTMRSQGFTRLRVDGTVYDIDDVPVLDKKRTPRLDHESLSDSIQ
jgi:excinuclease ABC subunit A